MKRLLLLVALFVLPAAASAQEKSINPGINKQFVQPNVPEFICDTYHHFEFPQKTMRSIHKALKPGGQVILIDFHRIEGVSTDWVMSHVRAGQDVFAKEISDAGYRQVEETKDVLKESYFVRFEKVAIERSGSKTRTVR